VDRVRGGEGPYFVEAMTYRLRTHAEGQPDLAYDQPREVEGLEFDPVDLARKRLLADGDLTDEQNERLEQQIKTEIADIERFCLEAPEAIPSAAALTAAAYAE
jgi:pyruvate dehydrogenase E1 component alpha subunit